MSFVAIMGALCALTPANVPVENQGFEQPVQNPNGFTVGAPPGWDFAGGSQNVGVFYPTDATWGYHAPFGHQVGYMNGGFLEQVLDEKLTADVPYKLIVSIINRPSFFQGYTVELWAGDTIIASDTDSLVPPVGGYLDLVLPYTADADDPLLGQPLKIRLGGPSQANFDNVRLLDGCSADCNGDGNLNILDFVCFQGLFVAGNPAADCNGDGNLNILDFVCFQGAFTAGCG